MKNFLVGATTERSVQFSEARVGAKMAARHHACTYSLQWHLNTQVCCSALFSGGKLAASMSLD